MAEEKPNPSPEPGAESGRLNLGGFSNFWTGNSKPTLLPNGFRHPRNRVFLNGKDLADVIDDDNDDFQYQIRYYNNPPPNQPPADEGISLGVVYASYVMGYGMAWEVVRGINQTVKYKSPFDKDVDMEVERSYTIKTVDRIQLKMVGGVKFKAPKKSKKNRDATSKDGEADFTPVKQLSIGCPTILIDKEGKPIRLSKRTREGKKGEGESKGEDIPIGLPVSEDYFDKYLEYNTKLGKLVSSFNIVKETKSNFLRPSLKFKGDPQGGEDAPAPAKLISGTLVLPESSVLWTGTSVGVKHGSDGRQIPMRIPAYELDLLFEDML